MLVYAIPSWVKMQVIRNRLVWGFLLFARGADLQMHLASEKQVGVL